MEATGETCKLCLKYIQGAHMSVLDETLLGKLEFLQMDLVSKICVSMFNFLFLIRVFLNPHIILYLLMYAIFCNFGLGATPDLLKLSFSRLLVNIYCFYIWRSIMLLIPKINSNSRPLHRYTYVNISLIKH